MNFLNWLSGTTPGTAIGQAGAEVVKGFLGSVESLIEEFHLSPEKAQEMRFKFKELELNATQAQLQDVQSARQMQMATRSPIPALLTIIITSGFFGILGIIIVYGMPKLESTGTEALLLLLGTLSTAFAGVLAFWMGKNSGSDETKQMLFHSTPAAPPPAN